MKPAVTFIVPCYNYGRYLPECVGSMLAQNGTYEIEIICIDDASTDDTRAVLQAFRDPRIRILLNERNLGHIGTVTKGLQAATGTYVSRIDPDDRLRPEFLERTVPILEQHPEVGLVYGDVALIDDAGTITASHADTMHGGRDFKGNEFVALLERNFICAPSVIARREAWLAALPVPEGLAFNDWHFTTMMARRHEFYFIAHVLAEYRVHAANLHSAIARDGSEERSVLRVLERYFGEVEESPALERAKRGAKRRIYAAHYVDFADKYFGTGQYGEARRCYVNALVQRHDLLAHPGVMRRLGGTILGQRLYTALKGWILRDTRPGA